MSRGPGRIERAIRELLDAHPDLAFVTDDLVTHCYPGITTIERKHQVSVLRAMHKVIANDPDWWEWKIECGQGSGAVFLNYGSLKSYTMGREMCWRYVSPKWGARKQHRRYTIGPSRFPWVDESSKPTDRAEFNASLKIEIGGLHDLEVQYHCANRDGFTVLADSLLNRIDALRGAPPKRYRADARNGMATLNPVALADRIRSLAVQNDPDALRAGLIAIAAELDAQGGAQ